MFPFSWLLRFHEFYFFFPSSFAFFPTGPFGLPGVCPPETFGLWMDSFSFNVAAFAISRIVAFQFLISRSLIALAAPFPAFGKLAQYPRIQCLRLVSFLHLQFGFAGSLLWFRTLRLSRSWAPYQEDKKKTAGLCSLCIDGWLYWCCRGLRRFAIRFRARLWD